MAQAPINGITLEYETFGDPGGRPLILIMGLGTQMISWPDEFCLKLAAAGHHVVRFDNRDVGLSTHLHGVGVPHIAQILQDIASGRPVCPPYELSDMAVDALGLMDALKMEKAHVCGLSMGGYIAQILAIDYPRRLHSLISMQSSTGAADLPASRPGVREAMIQPAPAQRGGYIDYMVTLHRLFSGGSDKFDPAFQADISARAFARAFHPAGVARHYAAVLSARSRKDALAGVRLPTLVIHGDADTLLPWEHGKATADAIPGARFHLVEGLGHGMAYPDLWDELVSVISAHTEGE
jgi:pimeloyl-ACP methyl ester carboxylesterase